MHGSVSAKVMRLAIFGRLAGAAPALLLLATGCQSLPTKMPLTKSWLGPEATYEVPEQMMVVWTDAVQTVPGQAPRRGCGGRLYFFDNKGRPIPVNGTLVVYAFDDAGTADGTRPQARFVFSPEQFTESFAESELGASYNIWIPWDDLGSPQKKLTLITVYRDASGKIVKADPAAVVLPGKVKLTDRQKRGFYEPDPLPGSQRDVRPVSYDQRETAPKRRLKTTTIRVPRSLSERMASLPPTEALDWETRRSRYRNAKPWKIDFSSPRAQGFVQQQARMPSESQVRQAASLPATPPLPARASSPYGGQTPIQAPPTALGYRGYTSGPIQSAPSARARAWSREDPRSARFARRQSPVPASPGVPPTASDGRWRQPPAAPQWNLPTAPAPHSPVPPMPAGAYGPSGS